MFRVALSALLTVLVMGGCIQDSDFEKLKSKKIDGWTYISTSTAEGSNNSTSASIFPKDDSGNLVYAAFECHNNRHLYLLIETFSQNINRANPIKMRYAKSAFGRFLVVDIKANNQHSNFTIVAQGANENLASISLHPGEAKLGQKLITSNLLLSIPTIQGAADIALQMDNPNIKKVFKDCGFKPAFMTSN
jgi:hypothetical protein